MNPQRLALAAALGALYAIATAWLVGAEGRSYRESLREARKARADVAATASALKDWKREDGDRSAHAEGGRGRTSPPGETAPEIQAGGGDLRSAAAAGSGDPRRAENPPAPAVALNVPAPKPAPTPKPASPAERSPEAIWADTLDLATITPEQEMRLGGVLNQFVLRTNAVDPDGDVKRLRAAADPLLKFLDRPEITYTFNVLRSDEVNAFSLPGGFVYVSSGLFSLVGEDLDLESDYVLQFALGHEIGHVDLRHALKLIAPGNEAAKKKGVDTLNQCLAPLIAAYPDAMEFEADAWAYDRMRNRLDPRRTRREGLMFLVQFEGYSKKHGFPNGRSVAAPSVGVSLVENHYRAHPAGWDRLNRLKALAGPLDPAPAPAAAKSR